MIAITSKLWMNRSDRLPRIGMSRNRHYLKMWMPSQQPQEFSSCIPAAADNPGFHNLTIAYLCIIMHIYAVRRTAPVAFSADFTAESRSALTSAPVRVRSAARKTREKAKEILPSPILS